MIWRKFNIRVYDHLSLGDTSLLNFFSNFFFSSSDLIGINFYFEILTTLGLNSGF